MQSKPGTQLNIKSDPNLTSRHPMGFVPSVYSVRIQSASNPPKQPSLGDWASWEDKIAVPGGVKNRCSSSSHLRVVQRERKEPPDHNEIPGLHTRSALHTLTSHSTSKAVTSLFLTNVVKLSKPTTLSSIGRPDFSDCRALRLHGDTKKGPALAVTPGPGPPPPQHFLWPTVYTIPSSQLSITPCLDNGWATGSRLPGSLL